MFIIKKTSVPTHSYNDKGLEDICHAESVSVSHSLGIPYGQTLTPTLSHRRGSNNGFTLAETLIAIVIVGVIAALTVPNMITDYQKKETVSRLKKIYSALNTALTTSVFENGNMSSWDCSFVLSEDNTKRAYCFKKYIAPYLKISKTCYYNEADVRNCWSGGKASYDNYYNISGEIAYSVASAVVLDDGMYIGINKKSGEPKYIVDINGKKGPNRFGRDQFVLNMNDSRNGKLEFWGYNRDRNYLTTNDNNGCKKGSSRYQGQYCGALILKDGWQIKNDYPW